MPVNQWLRISYAYIEEKDYRGTGIYAYTLAEEVFDWMEKVGIPRKGCSLMEMEWGYMIGFFDEKHELLWKLGPYF